MTGSHIPELRPINVEINATLSEGPGVYCLTHCGEVVYVGSSVNVNRRVKFHFWGLVRGHHKSDVLQRYYAGTNLKEWGFRMLRSCAKHELLSAEIEEAAPFETLRCSLRPGQTRSEHSTGKKRAAGKRQMSDPKQRAAAAERCVVNSQKVKQRWETDPEFRAQVRVNAQKGGSAIAELLKNPERMERHKEGIVQRHRINRERIHQQRSSE